MRLVFGRRAADAVQYQRDQSETPSPVLAGFDEVRDGLAQIGRGPVPDQAAGPLKDPALAEGLDLGFDLLNAATESRRQSVGIENRIRIAMKEHEDVPSQERPDMVLDELYGLGS